MVLETADLGRMKRLADLLALDKAHAALIEQVYAGTGNVQQVSLPSCTHERDTAQLHGAPLSTAGQQPSRRCTLAGDGIPTVTRCYAPNGHTTPAA